MGEVIEAILAGKSLMSAITGAIRLMGTAAIALILIMGLAFFLPTFIASIRKIRLRTFVSIANVITIVTLFLRYYIPIIIWLIIMIIAVCDKREKSKANAIPTINIIKYNEENE